MIRSIAGAFGALLTLMPLAVQAKPFTDAAGRTVELPDHIGKVLAAGPPASVLVYAIAPEKLAGWVREPKEDEKPYLMEAVRGLPTYGRLTGKGGTANIEAVLAAKPDVIIDVGTVDATYASLADKVQSQTGIPYVLIDGSFGKSAETLRSLGAMLGAEERAGKLADYADETLKELGETIAAVPADERPGSITDVAPMVWRRAWQARSILRSSKPQVQSMSRPLPARAVSLRFRRSSCSPGTRR